MHLPDALVFFGAELQRVSGWRTLSAKRRLKSLRVESRPRRKSRIGIRSVGAERRRRNSEQGRADVALEDQAGPTGVVARPGTETTASPSSTNRPSTRASQARRTLRPSGTSSTTSTDTVTTSPILTGAWKFKVWDRYTAPGPGNRVPST